MVLPFLCLQALVPAGFMPAHDSGTWLTMQLCTTLGLEERRVRLDAPTSSVSLTDTGESGQAAHAPCAYAVAAAAAPLPHVASPSGFVPVFASAAPQSRELPASTRHTGAHSARGPPSLLV
jgi:hypothetical protein